jgi:hypothetical protein
MRRGSVTRQFLKIKLKGQKDPALAGPYALFSSHPETHDFKQGLSSRRFREIGF